MTSASHFSTTLDTDARSDSATLSVSGEFDAATVPTFEAAASSLFELAPASMVLDLSDVGLIDSAAIGAIMRLRRRALAGSSSLSILAPQPYQRRLFEITGLSHILDPDDPA